MCMHLSEVLKIHFHQLFLYCQKVIDFPISMSRELVTFSLQVHEIQEKSDPPPRELYNCFYIFYTKTSICS